MLHKILNFLLLIFFIVGVGFGPYWADLYEKRKKRKLEEQKAAEEELKKQEAERIAKEEKQKLKRLQQCYIKYIFEPTLTHIDTLLLKYRKGSHLGDYDEVIDDEWQQDLKYFVEHIIETDAYTFADKYMCYPYTDEIFNDIIPEHDITFKVSDFTKIDYDIKIAMRHPDCDPECAVTDMVNWIVLLFSCLKP